MAANIAPIFPSVPVSQASKFVNADGTTSKALYTPGGLNGARVDGIIFASTDSIDHVVQLVLRRVGVSYLLGTIAVPINSGNSTLIPPVNAIDYLAALGPYSGFITDPYGNEGLYLDSVSSLWWAPLTIVTAPLELSGVVLGGEY